VPNAQMLIKIWDKIQEEDFVKTRQRDEILEPIILIINLNRNSLSEEENDDDD